MITLIVCFAVVAFLLCIIGAILSPDQEDLALLRNLKDGDKVYITTDSNKPVREMVVTHNDKHRRILLLLRGESTYALKYEDITNFKVLNEHLLQ